MDLYAAGDPAGPGALLRIQEQKVEEQGVFQNAEGSPDPDGQDPYLPVLRGIPGFLFFTGPAFGLPLLFKAPSGGYDHSHGHPQ